MIVSCRIIQFVKRRLFFDECLFNFDKCYQRSDYEDLERETRHYIYYFHAAALKTNSAMILIMMRCTIWISAWISAWMMARHVQ